MRAGPPKLSHPRLLLRENTALSPSGLISQLSGCGAAGSRSL